MQQEHNRIKPSVNWKFSAPFFRDDMDYLFMSRWLQVSANQINREP
jgi:hypothetical protein